MPASIKNTSTKGAPSFPNQTTRSSKLHKRSLKKKIGKLAKRILAIILTCFLLTFTLITIKQIIVRSTIGLSGLTDPRDGQRYEALLINGNFWMTQNLNYDTGEGCWFYDDDPKNGEKYGRLYTQEAALKACPSGWHLPSKKEWHDLIKYFGNPFRFFSEHGGKAAYRRLIDYGNSGFNAQLGGNLSRNGKYQDLGEYGNYWTSTNYSESYASMYFFSRYSRNLYQSSHYRKEAEPISCRCISD